MIQCDICHGNGRSSFGRCPEHRKCDDCETREELCFYSEGVFCRNCWNARIEERIKQFTGKTKGTRNMAICPHCGHSLDWWEYLLKEGSDNTMECPYCEREFVLKMWIDYTFTTRKPEVTSPATN